MKYVVAVAALAVAIFASTAQAALPPYADDGGSGFYIRVGDECDQSQEWSTAQGWNGQQGRVVTVMCQCSAGRTRCLWVQVSGYRTFVIRTARKGEA